MRKTKINSPPVLKKDERERADDHGGIGKYFGRTDDSIPWFWVDHAGNPSEALLT
jgi:hypothetical protein